MSLTMPTMTSMYAPAAGMGSYAAAPTMTSMYAPQQGASMYMPSSQYAQAPMTTTMAAPASMYQPAMTMMAPQTTMAAQPMTMIAPQTTMVTAAAPSFVPQQQPQVAGLPQFAVPQPVSLTAGLVPPQKVEAERVAYEKALAAQLDKQSKAVFEEAKIKQAMLRQQATTQIEQYKLQVEERTALDCLRCEQEAHQMVNGLKEAAITQQTAREEMAAISVADYNKRKAMEEMGLQAYQLQKSWFDQEAKLTLEYQRVMQAGSKAVITGGPMVPGARF